MFFLFFMLDFVITLGQESRVHHGLAVRSGHLSTNLRRKQSFEVLVLNYVSVLVNDSNCDQVVVLVDLVHDGAHDVKSVAVFDHIAVVLASTFAVHSLLVSPLLVTHVGVGCREGSCVAELPVRLLATCNYEVFSLLSDLVSNFLDDFFAEDVFVKNAYYLRAHDVPLTITFNLLHVEARQLILEIFLFVFVDSDLNSDQTGLFTLLNVEEEVALNLKFSQVHALDAFDAIALVEQVQIF